MNPSAKGWIKKLLKDLSDNNLADIDTLDFYDKLRQTGFIYGSNISTLKFIDQSFDFTEEERSKINLLLCFYHM